MFEGFGFVYLIYSGITKLCANIKITQMNNECKKITYNEKESTYIDYKGVKRDICTNEFRQTIRDNNGDLVLKGNNYETIRNYSEEERLIKPGSVTELAKEYDISFIYERSIGKRFKDRTNGDVYVIRTIKTKDDMVFDFFMDEATAKLIRPTDQQYAIERYCKENNKQYYGQDYFNSLIKEINSEIRDEDNPREYFMNDNVGRLNDLDEKSIKMYSKYRKEI